MTFPFVRFGALTLAAGLVLAAGGAFGADDEARPRAAAPARAARAPAPAAQPSRPGEARTDAHAGALDEDLRQGPGFGQGSLLHHARFRPGGRPAADPGDRRLSDGERGTAHRSLSSAGRPAAAARLSSGDRQGRADRRQVRDLLPQRLLRRGRAQQRYAGRLEEGADRQRDRAQSSQYRSHFQFADEGLRRRVRWPGGRSEGARAAEPRAAKAARGKGAPATPAARATEAAGRARARRPPRRRSNARARAASNGRGRSRRTRAMVGAGALAGAEPGAPCQFAIHLPRIR